ncbi:MAG: arginine--tRNA ligase [Armatimonadetes bacterium]|nr:arginine--tRNA ligase [Armatimonadota bacterium]
MLKEAREALAGSLEKSYHLAAELGELPLVSQLPEIVLERTREKKYGDCATNWAMLLARPLGLPPRRIAETLARNMPHTDGLLERTEVAGPGFVNFFLAPGAWWQTLRRIQNEGSHFGDSALGQGKRLQIEFVSANPTGPLNVVNARAATVGDVLARIAEKSGYKVEKEYYINDEGSQIENLGRSVEVRLLELLGRDAALGEDDYHGEYVKDLARQALSENQQLAEEPSEKGRRFLADFALGRIIAGQKLDLADFGVEFHVWFSQKSLGDEIQKTIDYLAQKGYTYEKDGAVWFASQRFGDDQDRVLVREDGRPTYFAADVTYHKNKLDRGFDFLINIWGPDHHGYITRLKAAVQALGYPEGTLEVILVQLVTLVEGGRQVRMSKRAGKLVSLRDLIEEVGRDAARFFFAMRHRDSHLEFDLDLARMQTEENPLYYVQYAHARICSILRKGAEAGIFLSSGETDYSPLCEEETLDLLKLLSTFPDLVQECAQKMEPHHLTRYAQDLASAFHGFYTRFRVLGEEPPVTHARLCLADAVRLVLAEICRLLGVIAPEHM